MKIQRPTPMHSQLDEQGAAGQHLSYDARREGELEHYIKTETQSPQRQPVIRGECMS